jgi:hypothetical protein
MEFDGVVLGGTMLEAITEDGTTLVAAEALAAEALAAEALTAEALTAEALTAEALTTPDPGALAVADAGIEPVAQKVRTLLLSLSAMTSSALVSSKDTSLLKKEIASIADGAATVAKSGCPNW